MSKPIPTSPNASEWPDTDYEEAAAYIKQLYDEAVDRQAHRAQKGETLYFQAPTSLRWLNITSLVIKEHELRHQNQIPEPIRQYMNHFIETHIQKPESWGDFS